MGRAVGLGVTLMSVSHDPGMVEFHDRVLTMHANGGYTLTEARHGTVLATGVAPTTTEATADEADVVLKLAA